MEQNPETIKRYALLSTDLSPNKIKTIVTDLKLNTSV